MRKLDVPKEYWDGAKLVASALKKKSCLANDSNSCDGPIVGAHTIPRSQLQQIATNGHVKALALNADALARNNGQVEFTDRGVGQFSVLNCFCQRHDNNLFSPIEAEPLSFDQKQLSLLHYRALGGELYKKNGLVESLRAQSADFAKKKDLQRASALATVAELHEVGLRDIEIAFESARRSIDAARYDDVSALIITFARMPTMMVVSAIAPAFDYQRRLVQRLDDHDILVDHVSLSVLAAENVAKVAMIWPKKSAAGKQFAESLLLERRDRLTTLLIETTVKLIENFCFTIPWWSSLKEAERGVLTRWVMNGEQTPDTFTFSGIVFDDWNYSSHEFKNIA